VCRILYPLVKQGKKDIALEITRKKNFQLENKFLFFPVGIPTGKKEINFPVA